MLSPEVVLLAGIFPIAVHALSLNITAVTTNGTGASIFECWSLRAPLKGSTQPGTVGAVSSFLGDVANMTYSVQPAGFNGGNHNTPYNQQVGPSLLRYHCIGLLGTNTNHDSDGILTLPDNPAAGFYAMRDMPSGIFFAADTADLSHAGHGSVFPGYTSTIFLQIPTLDNKVPEHTVLHAGVCTAKDIIGLNTL
ncbi:hypothetical protein PG984_015524 [Apiospora sp. TS-2023a]